ncbi:MAG: hypothetical protein H0T43_04185 [Solirubrobacterales bacterium]|nr:hypothetical protein [Solirubrobacterales bacterium]
MADIQLSAERVVHAIRTMRARAGRLTDVVGHSQGGMIPRWALSFWPYTRPMVDDLIAFAPSNHGTVDAEGFCATRRCPAAFHQQRRGEPSRSSWSGQCRAAPDAKLVRP